MEKEKREREGREDGRGDKQEGGGNHMLCAVLWLQRFLGTVSLAVDSCTMSVSS